MTDVYQQSIALHKQHQGKLEVASRISLCNSEDLSLAYTPGVAEPCRVIAKDVNQSFSLTCRGRMVAVVSDGSAVLGLGNIGPEASLPVMEGKSLLLKEFAGVDSLPLVLDTSKPEEIISTVRAIAPSFVGINLEDIAAPACFQIEEALQDLPIAVFHDDQHGTAIVVSAALHNAAKVVGKQYQDLSVVIVGAGAAGIATAKTLLAIDGTLGSYHIMEDQPRVAEVVLVDSRGALSSNRNDLNPYKQAIAALGNIHDKTGSLADVLQDADVVIGVSQPNLISPAMIQSMADKPIVFALANPDPEILPHDAKHAGAAVVATGRSDYPNQINNVLAFPGIFRAVVDGRLSSITTSMKLAAARALAQVIKNPTAEAIIPNPFHPNLAKIISKAVLSVQTSQ